MERQRNDLSLLKCISLKAEEIRIDSFKVGNVVSKYLAIFKWDLVISYLVSPGNFGVLWH